jgi:hypothetical protein
MANEVKLEAYYFQIKDQISVQKKKKKDSSIYHMGMLKVKIFWIYLKLS